MTGRKVLISEETLEAIAEGRVRYVKGCKIRLGRWILKERRGVLIGCKGEAEGKG